MRFGRLAILLGIALLLVIEKPVGATNPLGGPDILTVPMSWAAVQGSPAASSPNVPHPLPGGTSFDTSTDAILWRRHERPTDNIFLFSGAKGNAGAPNPYQDQEAVLNLRSGVANAWGALNFPIIPDTDTSLGVQGDILADAATVAAGGVEFNTAIANARSAWAALNPPFSQDLGITAINANRFHDPAGNYVGIIGWGGCMQAGGTCISPLDAVIMVVDNNSDYPGAGGLKLYEVDPWDQLVAHEVGHALGLPHRTASSALMNPFQVDQGPAAGQMDNIGLTAAEVSILRTNALKANGVEIDPPGVYDPGPIRAGRAFDQLDEFNNELPHLNLTSQVVGMDLSTDKLTLSQNLFGLIPDTDLGDQGSYWMFLNTDAQPETGLTQDHLFEIDGPATQVIGADLVVRVDAKVAVTIPEPGVLDRGLITETSAWEIVDDELIRVEDDIITSSIATLTMHPYYAAGFQPEFDQDYDVHHTIHTEVDFTRLTKPLDFQEGLQFATQVVTTFPGEIEIADQLADDEIGMLVALEHPSFPHGFVVNEDAELLETVLPGETVFVDVEDFLPNSELHLLLGDLEILGSTDDQGNGRIQVDLPENLRVGKHLVTVGVLDTALTADLTLFVQSACNPDTLGDIDGNGTVNFADFLVLSANFGQPATDHTTGDVDCNGEVNFGDFLILSSNFGSEIEAQQSVPEPSGFILFGIAMLSCRTIRRPRDSQLCHI